MVSCFISRLVILVFGTLYPAYASYKAVRTKNVKEYVKWMMYWIVFALFTCAETFTDLFFSFWFPFYYEIKIITVIYLLSPATKGSSILYRKFVHPVLIKREQEIDEYIAKAKEQGYHTMLNLGSKGVTYATSLIMQTAIKGGGGLVNQLKKSYSLSDLSEEQNLRSIQRGSEDDVDARYAEDIRRMQMQSPRRTISGTSPSGLYYPEVGDFRNPDQEQLYSQMTSSEDISSGYSSGDPLWYGAQPRERGDHLVRTASLGGTSRIRTRAATKAGLPKRSSLSEAGSSTWSAMESPESQIETDYYFNTPLQHSTSLPFSFTAFNPTYRPEFQFMFGNMPPRPMFPFIDPSQYSSRGRDFQEQPKTQIDEGSSVIISEVKSQDDEKPTQTSSKDDAKDCSTDKTDSSEVKELVKDEVGSEVSEKTEAVISDDTALSTDDLGEKEKSNPERCGKYKKKPAPVPPVEEPRSESNLNLEPDDVDSEFSTPNSSPLPERKFTESLGTLNEENDKGVVGKETKSKDFLEVPVKTKSHNKKEDSHGKHKISGKKIHIPKISFPFWNQKASSKHSSGSESSSVASVEVAASNKTEDCNKNDLEYIIPLKDEGETKDKGGDVRAGDNLI